MRLLLFLLGFMGTGFLIVVLYPYRVLILHLLIALLTLTLVAVGLIATLKIRRRIRDRRELEVPPGCMPRVHDDPPGGHPTGQDSYAPLPPFSSFQYTHDPGFQYLYDDRNSKRPSERLDPDQRRRF